MSNSFLEVLAEAEERRWCFTPFCGCYAPRFRSAVESINDLQAAFETMDLHELTSHGRWCNAVRIAAIDRRQRSNSNSRSRGFSDAVRTGAIHCGQALDWDSILSLWLSFARTHVRFADLVFYHLVRRVPCRRETRNNWLDTCIELARRTQNTSLVESLIYVLGIEIMQYPDILKHAITESSRCGLLRTALVKAHLRPSLEDSQRDLKHKARGHSLFRSILNNDVAAVRAQIRKGACLYVQDDEGRTPLEYASLLSRADMVSIIESARPDQQACWLPSCWWYLVRS